MGVRKGQLFQAASQAATATSVALATTYLGFCLSNPAASGIKIALRRVGMALSAAPAAISAIGLGGGYAAAGVTVHTTPLTIYPADIGITGTAIGKADAACTLTGLAPRVIMPMMNGFTAAALFPAGPAVANFEDEFTILPGGYIFIYTLTAVTGFFGMIWEEFRQ